MLTIVVAIERKSYVSSNQERSWLKEINRIGGIYDSSL